MLDMLKHLVPAIFSFLMVLAFNIKAFTEDDSFGAVVLLFILYGWSIIPFSYLIGFAFQGYGNAQVASFFLHFLMGGIGSLVVMILRFIPSTVTSGIAIGWFLRIIPSFSFGYGIVNIAARQTYSVVQG